MNTIQGLDISALLITSTNIYKLFLYFFFRSFEESGVFHSSHVSPIQKFFNFLEIALHTQIELNLLARLNREGFCWCSITLCT